MLLQWAWINKELRKWNSLIVHTEKGVVVWKEDQANYKHYLKPKSNPEQGLLDFVKVQHSGKTQKENLKLAEVGSWGLRKEPISVAWKYKVNQQVLKQKVEQVIHKF